MSSATISNLRESCEINAMYSLIKESVKCEKQNSQITKKKSWTEEIQEYSNMFKHVLVLPSQWLKIRKNWRKILHQKISSQRQSGNILPCMYKKTVVRLELLPNHFCTGLESGQLADIGEMLSKVSDLTQPEAFRAKVLVFIVIINKPYSTGPLLGARRCSTHLSLGSGTWSIEGLRKLWTVLIVKGCTGEKVT